MGFIWFDFILITNDWFYQIKLNKKMKRKIVGARERKFYVYIKMVYIGFVDKKISKCNHLIHLSLLFRCAYVIYHVPSEKHLYKSVFVFNSSHSFFA